MSRTVKFILFILIIFIAFILYLFKKNGGKQTDEIVYHNALERTIQITSTSFEAGGTIPVEFTGKGQNISPPLNWTNIPEGTKSLAIVVTDYDAPSPSFQLFTASHWVLYNISPKISELQKGITPEQLKTINISIGKNYAGHHVYAGPKPPIGVHSYYFRIYALDFQSLYLSDDNRDEVLHAMKNHILGYGELIGKF